MVGSSRAAANNWWLLNPMSPLSHMCQGRLGVVGDPIRAMCHWRPLSTEPFKSRRPWEPTTAHRRHVVLQKSFLWTESVLGRVSANALQHREAKKQEKVTLWIKRAPRQSCRLNVLWQQLIRSLWSAGRHVGLWKGTSAQSSIFLQ